jgi:hypothetical protein
MYLKSLARGIRCAAPLLLCAVPAAHAARVPANLLQNSGFEQALPGHPWMPAAWDTSESGLPTVFFGRDTFLVHSGNYAVTVANVSTVWPMSHNWSQALKVDRAWWGKDAVLSVWTRSNGLQGRGYILLQAYRDTLTRAALDHHVSRDSAMRILNIKRIDDPAYPLGWKRRYFSENETEWVRREVRVFLAPLTNTIFVRCGMTGTGQVIFDDASLTLETARPADPLPLNTNLLLDPSFEEGGNAWEFSAPPWEGMHVDVDSTIAHTGHMCGKATGGNNGWVKGRAGFCQVIVNRDLGGKQVRMSGYVRTDSLKGIAGIRLYAHTLHGEENMPPPMQFSNNTDWTLTSLDMDLPKDTYEVWAWFQYNAPVPGTVYYDDCSLEVIGPATGKYKAPPASP